MAKTTRITPREIVERRANAEREKFYYGPPGVYKHKTGPSWVSYNENDARHKPIMDLLSRINQGRPEDNLAPPAEGGWNKFGVDSKVLQLLSDPGPLLGGKTPKRIESPTSRHERWLSETHGFDREDVLSWNAYPWFRQVQSTGLSPQQIDEGTGPLEQLIGMLPKLKAVLLTGNEAKTAWDKFTSNHPDYLAKTGVKVIGPIAHASPESVHYLRDDPNLLTNPLARTKEEKRLDILKDQWRAYQLIGQVLGSKGISRSEKERIAKLNERFGLKDWKPPLTKEVVGRTPGGIKIAAKSRRKE